MINNLLFLLVLLIELILLLTSMNIILDVFVHILLMFIALRLFSKNKNIIFSVFFLFTILANTYSVFGKGMWLLREYVGMGYPVDPVSISRFYRFFCEFFTVPLLLTASRYSERIRSYSLNLNSKNFGLKLTLSFSLTIFGAFILTNGFTSIAILSDNPDLVRYDSRSSELLTVGSIFMISSVHGVLLSFHRFKTGRMSLVRFLAVCFVFLFLLSLNTSRFLLAIPILFTGIYSISFVAITRTKIVGLILISIVVLLSMQVFGTYRAYGASFSFEHFLIAFSHDFFPEYWGTVKTSYHTSQTVLIEPISIVGSGIFPNALFNFIGLEKGDYFVGIGRVIGDLWNTQYSIRLSLIGELYYSSIFSQIFVFAFLFIIFLIIDYYSFFKRGNYISFLASIFVGLSIPYGFMFFIISIQFLIFSYVLSRFFLFSSNINRKFP